MPVVLGILALVYLIRGGHRDWVAYLLAVLSVVTGLGSAAWHSTRDGFALDVDWMSGAVYFVVVAGVWAWRVGGPIVSLVLLVALSVLAFIVPWHIMGQYWTEIVVAIALIAVALVVATWWKGCAAFYWGLATVAVAGIALAMRTLDSRVCETVPIGTHFLWHVFLGFAAFAGVWLTVRLGAPSRR